MTDLSTHNLLNVLCEIRAIKYEVQSSNCARTDQVADQELTT